MPRHSLLHPQEVEVFFILPALRRDLAMAMKKNGIEQKVIAQRLGITEPAVSQYLNNKRATKVNFAPAMKTAIEEAALRIVDEVSLVKETQLLIGMAREELMTSKIYDELMPSLKGYRACLEAEGPTIIQVDL